MRVLISNMTILLSNSNPKIPKSDIFSPKFKDFHFSTKLCNKTSLKMLLSNMTFKFQPQKYANLAFLVLNLGIFIFYRDYKYDNILSTFQPKDPNRAFLVTIFFFFCRFGWNFIVSQIQGCCLKTWCWNKALVPSLKFFCFWMKLCISTNSTMLFQIWH